MDAEKEREMNRRVDAEVRARNEGKKSYHRLRDGLAELRDQYAKQATLSHVVRDIDNLLNGKG